MDIKKLFKIQKKFRKGGFHANPNVGWEVIALLALLLILGIFIFGFFLFRWVNLEFIAPSTSGGRTPMVDEDRINRALDYFAEREKKSVEILSAPAPVVDPSL